MTHYIIYLGVETVVLVPKISIEPLEHWHALLMTWSLRSNREDVNTAFHLVQKLLNQSPDSIFLVVDLRHNISLPISDMVHLALDGIYLHPKLKQCLVIGGNSQARAVGNILCKITGQDKIVWFADEEAVYSYLSSKLASNGY